MGESAKGQEVLTPYPNGDGSKIPFHSRIGTKLIVGFLIIALFNRRQAAINAMKVAFGILLLYGALLFISNAVLPRIFGS